MGKKTIMITHIFNDLIEVISVNGGWTAVKFLTGDKIGKEGRLRNGAYREPTAAELASLNGPAKPDSKARARVKTSAPDEDGEDTADSKLVNPDYGRYVRHEVKSTSGRRCLDINDEAAALLRGQDIDDCYFIVAKHAAKAQGGSADTIEGDLKAEYQHLNVGMQRMNLGNRLRKLMGTYGNLNARKGNGKAGSQEHIDYEKKHGEEASILKYGRRANDTLKRSTDPKDATV